MKWRPGTTVEVRSAAEILRTLDDRGMLRGLPFMPEMLAYCGKQFRIFRRIEKTCAESADSPRRMRAFDGEPVVLLEGVRCDASGHDGCDRACAIFWHTAWLAEAGEPTAAPGPPAASAAQFVTRTAAGAYVCQSTELWRATQPLTRDRRIRVAWQDVRLRTYPLTSMVRSVLVPVWLSLMARLGFDGQVRGTLTKTPQADLGLQPGDFVRVKAKEEIFATLDRGGANRGLEFGPLMYPFCGRVYKVRQRVERIILETTGEMREVRSTVILESATCDGRVFFGGCPRDEFHFWREAWLTRVEPSRP